LVRSVAQTIMTHGMLRHGDAVLIGVSGGPDSVALLHILIELSPRFCLKLAVAHLDHCLRPQDSEREADAVAELARRAGLTCFIEKKEVRAYGKKLRLSLEEAGRQVRYTFYNSLADKHQFDRIALGHHADDNAELVLMSLIRGSGPLGISGIPPTRRQAKSSATIIRPLIELTKSDILRFLSEKGLRFETDPSNSDTRFLRNRIRHHLIPALQKSYNPKIVETLNRLSRITRSEEEWAEGVVDPVFDKWVQSDAGGKLVLSVAEPGKPHAALIRRIIRRGIAVIKGDLRRITFVHIEAATRLMLGDAPYGTLDLPAGIRIERRGTSLVLLQSKKSSRMPGVNGPETGRLEFEYRISEPGIFFIREINAYLVLSEIRAQDLPILRSTGYQTAFFDIDKIEFPMTLRTCRPGDRFTPLGVAGSQKIKKFFIDHKISRQERIICPLLLSREKIIWVVGHRIDDAYKVTTDTRKVLKGELLLA
jgi:tRNA(Ile)-lysidine synthase